LREENRPKIFENRMPARIFVLKSDGEGKCRRLHSEELFNLSRSPNIIRVIKSRKLRWTEHVARMNEGRSVFRILKG